jgi:hypothetical protein
VTWAPPHRAAYQETCPGCGHRPDLVCNACNEHACLHGVWNCPDAEVAGTRHLKDD